MKIRFYKKIIQTDKGKSGESVNPSMYITKYTVLKSRKLLTGRTPEMVLFRADRPVLNQRSPAVADRPEFSFLPG